MNIVEKALELFDSVIIAKGVNPNKESCPRALPNLHKDRVYYSFFEGLLGDYLKSKEAADRKIFLIRGLRNASDFDHERMQETWIKETYPQLKVVYITCDPELVHISSSALRDFRKFTDITKYVPKCITYLVP